MSTAGRGRLRHVPGHVTFLSLKLHFLKLPALKIFKKEVLWENYRPHGMIDPWVCWFLVWIAELRVSIWVSI